MSNHTKTYRIAAISGDGIGIEVVEVALEVLQTVAKVTGSFTVETTKLPWGSAFYKKNGYYLPQDFLGTLKAYDAILFGAVGAPGMCTRNTVYIYSYAYNDRQTSRITSRSGVSF